LCLGEGKMPIVVPRRKEFGEHVDNHQVKFASMLAQKKRILFVDKIDDLQKAINDYDHCVSIIKCTGLCGESESRERSDLIMKLLAYCRGERQ